MTVSFRAENNRVNYTE